MLPLELYLQSNRSKKFPDSADYFARYQAIKDELANTVYKEIPAMSTYTDATLYTHHGIDHINDVIEYCGKLIGLKNDENLTPAINDMTPFESYLILVSILLHDSGMIYGRENHEEHIQRIVTRLGPLLGDDNILKSRITSIAQAHSGKIDGSPVDTISKIQAKDTVDYLGCKFRPKMIAALVRFADEICETKKRASRYCLRENIIPHENEAFHHYANSINSVDYDQESKSISIMYEIISDDLSKQFGINKSSIYLIDMIRDRLNKINTERKYYNRFIPLEIRIEKISATIEIYSDQFSLIGTERYSTEDRGYPHATDLMSHYPNFTVKYYEDKYARVSA